MAPIIGWLTGLSTAGRVGLAVASLFTVGVVSDVITTPEPINDPPEQTQQVQGVVEVEEAAPVIETKTVKETTDIAFKTIKNDDPTINKGEQTISQSGVKGKLVTTYEVTYTDGEETGRKKISEEITKPPVNKIVLVGTYVYVAPKPAPVVTQPASNCDPNYSGGCVPIASDVDCAGGSGNGPAYVAGPVTVIGIDIYGLDRDNDGIGCE